MARLTYAQQAAFFGALAHAERLRILDLLADGEACVCHLAAALHQTQAYVSQQLARLKETGLIVDRRDGVFVNYALADAGIVELVLQGREVLRCIHGMESFAHSEVPPQGDPQCTCPRCQGSRIAGSAWSRAASTAS